MCPGFWVHINWRLLLLFSVSSPLRLIAMIVRTISITVTMVLITVVTTLIVSNRILTFLRYFPHWQHLLSCREARMNTHTSKGEPLSAMDNTPRHDTSEIYQMINVVGLSYHSSIYECKSPKSTFCCATVCCTLLFYATYRYVFVISPHK